MASMLIGPEGAHVHVTPIRPVSPQWRRLKVHALRSMNVVHPDQQQSPESTYDFDHKTAFSKTNVLMPPITPVDDGRRPLRPLLPATAPRPALQDPGEEAQSAGIKSGLTCGSCRKQKIKVLYLATPQSNPSSVTPRRETKSDPLSGSALAIGRRATDAQENASRVTTLRDLARPLHKRSREAWMTSKTRLRLMQTC